VKKFNLIYLVPFLILFITGCGSSNSFNIIKIGSNERKISKQEYKKTISKYNLEIANTNPDNIELDDALSSLEPLDISLNKFALLFEKNKIGKYALNSTKIMTSYLTTKNSDFLLKTFDINSDLSSTIDKIRAQKFAYVIAIITNDMLEALVQIANANPDMKFYVPTIHKSQLDILTNQNRALNITFGGIDYQRQIQELAQFTNSKISLFSIKNSLGKNLRKYIYDTGAEVVFDQEITSSTGRFDMMIEEKYILNDTAMYLNTPIVKSSLILSQLRIYEMIPYPILSTQLSYNRLIFSLTQPKDRQNLIVANSIINYDKIVDENSKLLGTNIDFDWINYSTCIGIDDFYAYINQSPRTFNEPIEDNQVQYSVQLLKPNSFSFGLIE
jgi:SRSO17 transposase